VVLAGPSGSGKTTLLSLIGCMSRPTSGRIVVDGQDVAKLADPALTAVRRRRFGFIFQQLNLIADLSVIDNVMLPLYPVPMAVAEMVDRADTALSRLALSHRRGFKVRTLSGGEQQRVAIARAFASRPNVLFADEPTGNLDTVTGQKIIELIFDLNAEFATTLVLVTHDDRLASRCQRVIELEAGRIVG